MNCQCEMCQPISPSKTWTREYMRECFDRHLSAIAKKIASLSSIVDRRAELAKLRVVAPGIAMAVEAKIKNLWAVRK